MKRWCCIVFLLLFGCHAQPSHREPGPIRIVLLGDSVGHGAGDETGLGIGGNLDRQLTLRGISHRVPTNAAVSGSRTWNVLQALSQTTLRQEVQQADVVVLSIGGNDLYGDSRARLLSTIVPPLQMALTLDRITAIVTTVHRLNPTTRLFLVGIYNPYPNVALNPHVTRWNGLLFGRFAEDGLVTVVNIADLFRAGRRISSLDHFHPNHDGYAEIARRVADSI